VRQEVGDGHRRGGRQPGLAGGQRQVQALARTLQLHHGEADKQRGHRGGHEPRHGPRRDPADGLGVAHLGDAGHQGGEHQRRDQHLDGAQEEGGDRAEPAGDRLQGAGIADQRVAGEAGGRAQAHAEQHQTGQTAPHRDPPKAAPRRIAGRRRTASVAAAAAVRKELRSSQGVDAP
jgi:hypothetical protein